MSGRLLPGFTSPNEPEFSLLKIRKFSSNERNKSISERIQLDDSPAVRLVTLNQLFEQITDLLENTANPVSHDPASSRPSVAGGRRHRTLCRLPSATRPGCQIRKVNLTQFVMRYSLHGLSQASYPRSTELIAQPNSNVIDFSKEPTNGRLRSLLFGKILLLEKDILQEKEENSNLTQLLCSSNVKIDENISFSFNDFKNELIKIKIKELNELKNIWEIID